MKWIDASPLSSWFFFFPILLRWWAADIEFLWGRRWWTLWLLPPPLFHKKEERNPYQIKRIYDEFRFFFLTRENRKWWGYPKFSAKVGTMSRLQRCGQIRLLCAPIPVVSTSSCLLKHLKWRETRHQVISRDRTLKYFQWKQSPEDLETRTISRT